MRLMQAIGGAGHGGAETFFVNLAGAFHRAGFEQLVTMRANETRKQQLIDQGLHPTELKFGGKLDIFTQLKLNSLAKDFKPDIFLAWMSRAAAAAPKGNFPKIARLGGYYKVKYFRKCDFLVCNTEEICDFVIQQGWPSDKILYIPNFLTWQDRPAIKRSELQTPEEAPVLLSLGRLHYNKAMDTALKVTAKLEDTFLWIAGAGDLEKDLKSQATDLGIMDRVRFLGWRTDKEALFAAADVCLYPSRIEPFGNVTLDAWASKTPVVAAASAGPAAYIRHGETGLLGEIDNVEELTSLTRQLIEDKKLAATLIENGRQEYESKFTGQVAVQNWKTLFEQLT
ncbi:MAG: glycosyltransferase [Sneathiellales bacterium]|nr:glycosyltransferase [Sneathiellales bacterium]